MTRRATAWWKPNAIEVIAFRERPSAGHGSVLPGTINAGVYLFDRRVLADVTPVCSLERDVMPALAARGVLRGTAADGYFIDIGIPADLARAQTGLPARLQRSAVLVPQALVIGSGRLAEGAGAGCIPESIPALRAIADAGRHVFLLMTNPFGDAARSPPVQDAVAMVRAQGGVIDDLWCPPTVLEAGDRAHQRAEWDRSWADFLRRWSLEPSRCCLLAADQQDETIAATAGLAAVRVGSVMEFATGFGRSA